MQQQVSAAASVIQLIRLNHPKINEKGEKEWFEPVKIWHHPRECEILRGVRIKDVYQSAAKKVALCGKWWFMYLKEWNAGMRPDPSRRVKNLAVWVYDQNFNLIHECANPPEAEKVTKVSKSNIQLTLVGRKLFILNNFHFSYKKYNEEEIQMLHERKQWELDHHTLSLKHGTRKDEEYRKEFHQLRKIAPPIPVPEWALLEKPYEKDKKDEHYGGAF